MGEALEGCLSLVGEVLILTASSWGMYCKSPLEDPEISLSEE